MFCASSSPLFSFFSFSFEEKTEKKEKKGKGEEVQQPPLLPLFPLFFCQGNNNIMFATFKNGFLPSRLPLNLPREFRDVEALVSAIPSLIRGNGSLADHVADFQNFTSKIVTLTTLIDSKRPSSTSFDLLKELGSAEAGVDTHTASENEALLHALFRDYAIISSTYLLEPKSRFGEPVRTTLPPQLAIPLWTLSHALGLPPFLEYTSYWFVFLGIDIFGRIKPHSLKYSLTAWATSCHFQLTTGKKPVGIQFVCVDRYQGHQRRTLLFWFMLRSSPILPSSCRRLGIF